MQEVKYCQRCGVVICDAYNTDWYAYISQKYCKECKKICDQERKAEWARNKRRKVALAKAAEERERLQLRRAESRELTLQRQKNKVMEQEIAALQAYIVKLRELT